MQQGEVIMNDHRARVLSPRNQIVACFHINHHLPCSWSSLERSGGEKPFCGRISMQA